MTEGGRPTLSLPAPAARLLTGVFGVLGVCIGERSGKDVGEANASFSVCKDKKIFDGTTVETGNKKMLLRVCRLLRN